MPRGTKVDRCFQKLKHEKGEGSAAAICQKSTGQSLATGKPLHVHGAGSSRRKREEGGHHGR